MIILQEVSMSKLFRRTLLYVLAVIGAEVFVHAQTYSVLYNFGITRGDPTMFEGVIAQGRDGNLYVTATHGGANGVGAAFKITPAGKVTVLYSFCSQASCADGEIPVSGLTLGRDGNFYGTTAYGGSNGYGVIFKIRPPAPSLPFTTSQEAVMETIPMRRRSKAQTEISMERAQDTMWGRAAAQYTGSLPPACSHCFSRSTTLTAANLLTRWLWVRMGISTGQLHWEVPITSVSYSRSRLRAS
jgi:uncharacterized repeat protein (TIGR03803 family)